MRFADRVGKIFEADQLLGLAVRGGKIDSGGGGAGSGVQVRELADHFIGGVNARLRFCGSGLWPAAQPFDFRVHAIFERFLPLALRVEIFLFRFEERAVVSADAQKTILIHARKLDHFGRDIFEKVAIVADHHARERRVLQKRFKPVDSREVQMIGRLIEQQNVRALAPGLRQSPGACASRPTSAAVGVSRSVKLARPSVSANREARSA